MRHPFMKAPWLNIKEETLDEIESRMPQFLFYRREGRKRALCQCSACGNTGVAEISGKSGEAVLCPFCMEPVELKCSSRLRDDAPSLRRWINVIYFVNRGGSLWAVGCRIERTFYREEYDAPWRSSMDVIPFEVWNFAPGTAEEYHQSYGLYGAYDGMDWYGPVKPREPQTGGMTGENSYYLWQTEAIDETEMRYCRSGENVLRYAIEDGILADGVIRYLTRYATRPKLELVCKWGLMDIARDWVWRGKSNGRQVNWEANTPWEFLKIGKADWKCYRESEYASVGLLAANRKHFRLPVREVLEIAGEFQELGNRWVDTAAALTLRGFPIKDQMRYLRRQIKDGRNMAYTIRLWADYLHMAENAGRDMSQQGARMPRDLQKAHDDIVEYTRAAKAEERARQLNREYQGYAKRRDKLKRKYEYRSHGLMIKVPEDGGEIIREGNVLRICVGGYAARHLGGQTAILFLRRQRRPMVPYICIEIREKDNTIVQIHGYRNEYLGGEKRIQDPQVKFKAFLDEWLAWVRAGSKKETSQKRKDETA